MIGIGACPNKFETCRNCKDRTVEPNCHNTCQGYIARQKKKEEIKTAKNLGKTIDRYKTESITKRKRKDKQ